MALAHTLANFGMQEKALRTGYKALRKFHGVPAAHLGYCGLILQALKQIPVIDQVKVERRVAVDTAFTCLTEDSRSRTFVIEPDSFPDSSAEEIKPTNLIAQRAIGLCVGDSFPITDTPTGQQFARITEVKHKYLHALHESMINFQYRFSGVPGMWMYSVGAAEDGTMNLQPILDTVSQRQSAVQAIEDVYRKNPIPLALVAHRLGEHPLDCLMGLSRSTQIKSCQGFAVERDQAINTALTATKGFIIDPFSLYTFQRLGLLDLLLELGHGQLGITQSAIDLIVELIEKRKAMGPCLMLSKQDDQFVKEDVTQENVQLSLEIFEKLLTWCQLNCEIIPAVGKQGAGEEVALLFSELDPVFLDTLLAASATGRVLISEDLHYRQVGSLCFGVEGVWAQPLLWAARKQTLLPPAAYHEAILQLIDMNYGFISISTDDLLHHLGKTGYTLNGDFQKLLEVLSTPNTDIMSAIYVVANFLATLITRIGVGPTARKATYAVLTHLSRHPMAIQSQIAAMLIKTLARKTVIEDSLGIEEFRELFNAALSWCMGNFLHVIARDMVPGRSKRWPPG